MQGTGWVVGWRCAGDAGVRDGWSSGVLWGLTAGNRTEAPVWLLTLPPPKASKPAVALTLG